MPNQRSYFLIPSLSPFRQADFSPTLLKGLLVFSLVFHLWAAVFSDGFYEPDEHFQILEFTGMKLGLGPESDLTWEYRSRIRPWFQPGCYALLAACLKSIGVTSPFAWAFCFRLISALLGWVSVFAAVVWGWTFLHPGMRSFHALLICTLWYFPFLHARTSSEGWAGSFFLLGLCFLFQKRFRTGALLVAGLSLGFAVESRFQMAIGVGSALLWTLVLGRERSFRSSSLVLGGLGLALVVGSLFDRWGYGAWQCTAWRYFKVNLIDGEAKAHGIAPVYEYFKMLGSRLTPPLALLISGTAGLVWIRNFKSVITWASLPFFLIHCFIEHKEFRFLFPLAGFVPFFICLALQDSVWLRERISFLFSKFVWIPVYAINLILLGLLSSLSVRAEMATYRPLYELQARDIYYSNLDPYKPRNIPLHFYRPAGRESIPIRNLSQLEQTLKHRTEPLWLFSELHGHDGERGWFEPRCRFVYSSFPTWIRGPVREWIASRGLSVWNLYRCDP